MLANDRHAVHVATWQEMSEDRLQQYSDNSNNSITNTYSKEISLKLGAPFHVHVSMGLAPKGSSFDPSKSVRRELLSEQLGSGVLARVQCCKHA